MQQIGALVKKRVERIIVENALLRAGFAAFPYLVMKDKALSLGARMTYAFLLMYAWQEGSCFPGQVKLAGEMGVSERQLRRYLYELSENAYVRIERTDKRFNNTYTILDKKPSKLKAKKA
jgi:AraC-like DNA-binding protein